MFDRRAKEPYDTVRGKTGTLIRGVPESVSKLAVKEGCGVNLKPLEDRVIVKALEEEEKTASGIVLPDTAKEKPMKGTVVAVGDGKWDDKGEKRVPVDVKVGDTVIYGKYSGTDYKTQDGEELLILRASEILAIIE
jgi:chaperonin GroES